MSKTVTENENHRTVVEVTKYGRYTYSESKSSGVLDSSTKEDGRLRRIDELKKKYGR